jgi:hypothetical protein
MPAGASGFLAGRSSDMKRSSFFERRTKIVCTIGPATGSAALLSYAPQRWLELLVRWHYRYFKFTPTVFLQDRQKGHMEDSLCVQALLLQFLCASHSQWLCSLLVSAPNQMMDIPG